MTFEQWIEIAKVISPALVGLITGLSPAFWIIRELNGLIRTQVIIIQNLKDIVKSIHDLDIRLTKLEPK